MDTDKPESVVATPCSAARPDGGELQESARETVGDSSSKVSADQGVEPGRSAGTEWFDRQIASEQQRLHEAHFRLGYAIRTKEEALIDGLTRLCCKRDETIEILGTLKRFIR